MNGISLRLFILLSKPNISKKSNGWNVRILNIHTPFISLWIQIPKEESYEQHRIHPQRKSLKEFAFRTKASPLKIIYITKAALSRKVSNIKGGVPPCRCQTAILLRLITYNMLF